MSSVRNVLWSVAGLVVCLLLFAWSDLDMMLQRMLFDYDSMSWVIDKHDVVYRAIFYNGIKYVLYGVFALLLAASVGSRYLAVLRPFRHGLRVTLLSLMLVPAVVGLLKNTTNIACPANLIEFGGTLPYARIFAGKVAATESSAKQRCFPAGHASGGFALLSCIFLFRATGARFAAAAVGLAIGWTMGGYKMLIGDHFLSHTLITCLLAWAIINLVVLADRRCFRSGEIAGQ